MKNIIIVLLSTAVLFYISLWGYYYLLLRQEQNEYIESIFQKRISGIVDHIEYYSEDSQNVVLSIDTGDLFTERIGMVKIENAVYIEKNDTFYKEEKSFIFEIKGKQQLFKLEY